MVGGAGVVVGWSGWWGWVGGGGVEWVVGLGLWWWGGVGWGICKLSLN